MYCYIFSSSSPLLSSSHLPTFSLLSSLPFFHFSFQFSFPFSCCYVYILSFPHPVIFPFLHFLPFPFFVSFLSPSSSLSLLFSLYFLVSQTPLLSLCLFSPFPIPLTSHFPFPVILLPLSTLLFTSLHPSSSP